MRLNIKHIALITLGWTSVFLGVLGIFLPLLPTTPFILLAAWCFSKSSKRFSEWLNNHPKLGPIIHTWRSGKGIPRRTRNRTIFAIAASMGLSAVIIGKAWVALLLLVIGGSVTYYLLRLPLAPEEQSS